MKGDKNQKQKVLILESSDKGIDSHRNYQILHDKLYHLVTKRIDFKENFHLINNLEFKKHQKLIFKLTEEFKVTIINFTKGIKPNKIESIFKVKLQKRENWESESYSIYTNLNKYKIVIYSQNFEGLNREEIDNINFNLIHYLSIEDIIYYQFNCKKCNNFNLIILNKKESPPKKCKYCPQIIVDPKGNKISELLILENGELRNEF